MEFSNHIRSHHKTNTKSQPDRTGLTPSDLEHWSATMCFMLQLSESMLHFCVHDPTSVFVPNWCLHSTADMRGLRTRSSMDC